MSVPVRLALIVARARNGVIGRDNSLPWRLADDMAHFRKVTRGKPLIMGRKTWDSFPRRPLPGRPNLVLTRDTLFQAPGGFVYASLPAAIAAAKGMATASGADEVMILGGQAVYTETLPMVDRLYLTEVDADVQGDAVFPDFDESEFEINELARFSAGENNEHAYRILQLDRMSV